MKKHIIDDDGNDIEVVEAIPECGDCCDACGDCIHCYGEDDCGAIEGAEHYWVVYKDKDG